MDLALSALDLLLAGHMDRAMMKVHAKPPRPKPEPPAPEAAQKPASAPADRPATPPAEPPAPAPAPPEGSAGPGKGTS
jgi:PTH1 family peptidyl-tRNA hydrolase